MLRTKRTLLLPVFLFCAYLSNAFALQESLEQQPLVGHITHIEGDVLRYVPDVDDWVPTAQDAPCGTDDVLYAERNAKAELIIPNSTWIRLGSEARLTIKRIGIDATAIDIESGTARLYNKSSTAIIKTSTPFGTIKSPPDTICDLYLEEDSLLVTALKGSVDFLNLADNTHYGITAGIASLRAGFEKVTTGAELVDDTWHAWNAERDGLWNERFAEQGDSPSYLPEELQYASYALEENGTWENVYYEGSYRYCWRPRCVSPGWSPFTAGKWTVWYGDHCWIPCEPFGYITHHYGNWVYLDSCSRWYWAPPHCGTAYGWYPGRVSWIYRGSFVGWIPLAPLEPYYCHHYWGPRSCTLPAGTKRVVHFDTKDCRYKKHSIIVRKAQFYDAADYSAVRLRKIQNNCIDNYHRVTHINSRVIRNFKENRQRFTFRRQFAKHNPNRIITKGINHRRGWKRSSLRKGDGLAQNRLGKTSSRKATPVRAQRLSPRITTTEGRSTSKRERFTRKAAERSEMALVKPRTRGTAGRNLTGPKHRRAIERKSRTAGFKRRISGWKQQRSSRAKQVNRRRTIGLSMVPGRLL